MNIKVKYGIVLIIIGLSLPMISFGFTSGYEPRLGLLENIRNMNVYLREGKYEEEEYLGENWPMRNKVWKTRTITLETPVTISYPLVLAFGVILASVGTGLVLLNPQTSESLGDLAVSPPKPTGGRAELDQ